MLDMTPSATFAALLKGAEPLLALAPMQDVTDLAFWRVMARYGGADAYWTEYFRVHAASRPEKWIVDSILQNPTGRPVVAQMIGNAGGVPQMRRRGIAARTGEDRRDSGRAARGGCNPVDCQDADWIRLARRVRGVAGDFFQALH